MDCHLHEILGNFEIVKIIIEVGNAPTRWDLGGIDSFNIFSHLLNCIVCSTHYELNKFIIPMDWMLTKVSINDCDDDKSNTLMISVRIWKDRPVDYPHAASGCMIQLIRFCLDAGLDTLHTDCYGTTLEHILRSELMLHSAYTNHLERQQLR